MFVDGRVVCQLRMKGRSHDIFALDQRRLSRVFGKNLYTRPGALNHRPANEYHFQRLFLERGGTAYDIASDLPPVRVSDHRHIHEIQRILLRMRHIPSKQNRTRARSENCSAALGKFYDFVRQAFFLQKLQLSGAFAAGKNQPVAAFEVSRRAHFGRLRAKLFQHRRVRLKISLHCQNPDFHCFSQATVAITYGIQLGVPVYCYDSSRNTEGAFEEISKRLKK